MKCKKDFVTNSSSTSFIFESETLLSNYENILKRLETENDVMNVLIEISDVCYIDDYFQEEKLKTVYGFKNKQINVVKALLLNKLDLYEKLCKMLKQKKIIYYLCIDNNWLYEENDLIIIIESSNIISREEH